jgi:phospholipid/cholesterol/gamma-HCH transport system substrate-binding protein
MAEYKRNIAVGLTTLAGLAGLLILMVMFGRLPGITGNGYQLHVILPSAGGLHEDSTVKLSGIQVGRIESVAFREGSKAGVRVTARIQRDIDIPQAATAEVARPLLGGSPTLELHVPPDKSSKPTLSKTEPATLQGQVGGMARQIAGELKGSLQEPMGQIEEVSQSVEQLSAEWTKVGQRINNLVAPRDAAEVDAGQSAPNLVSVVRRADRRMKQLGETLTSIEKLVGDKQIGRDLRATLKNAREASNELSDEIKQVSGQFNQVSDKIVQSTDALQKRYVALADDLAGATGSMQKLMQKAQQGEGTVGKLLNDPSLYQNLNDAAKRINKAVDEMKLLILKWKAEGVPVQF